MANEDVGRMMGLNVNTCTVSVEAKSPMKTNLEKPCVGMLFDEEDALHMFYTNYAQPEGFGIVRWSSNLGIDGKLKYFMLSRLHAGNWCNTSNNALHSKSLWRNCKR